MKRPVSDKLFNERMIRWRFYSVLGACMMFIKGTGHLDDNPHVTREILDQHKRACEEVEKLSLLISRKGTP